jgi:hypothetical protein
MEAMDCGTTNEQLPRFGRQLKLLKYPGHSMFDIYTTSRIKELVLWLEEHEFQYLQPEEKIDLQKQEGDEWRANAFHLVSFFCWCGESGSI